MSALDVPPDVRVFRDLQALSAAAAASVGDELIGSVRAPGAGLVRAVGRVHAEAAL